MPFRRGILISSTARSAGRLGQAAQGFIAIGIGADLEPFGLQRHLHRGQDIAVVINQSDVSET